MHQYWEKEIFRGIPIGKRDRDGRELSDEEQMMSNEVRELVWEGCQREGGDAFVVTICVEHSYNPEAHRDRRRYDVRVRMTPNGLFVVADVEAPLI